MRTVALTGTLSSSFEAAAQPSRTAFKYGWCTTDHKDGKEIRRYFRKHDYLKDEPYASRVKAMLEQLGLPIPETQEIFRGSHHDLLFINSHGVVVRIGPTDVEDMINPAILQPLGWLEDPKIMAGSASLTVAVYPGIELYKHWSENKKGAESVGDLRKILEATGQRDGDCHEDNIGIIRVLDDQQKEVAVEMLLDPDNKYNSSSGKLREQRTKKMAETEALLENKGDVLSATMQGIFDTASKIKYWQRAFEVHQPLRRLFWDAFKDVKKEGDKPDIAARSRFWESCARVTNNPTATIMPIWRTKRNFFGMKKFVREERFVPHVVLYHPWTGEKADNAVQPISIDPALKEKIRKEHSSLSQQSRNKNPEPVGLFCR